MKLRTFIPVSIIALMLVGAFSGMHSYQTQNLDDYISFTAIHMTAYDEASDVAEYEAAVYEYNLQSKQVSEIFRFPYNTLYPLGVYDKKTNSVYYTKEKNNNSYKNQRTGGDQIYVYDLATGSDTMLTEDLLAVNHIVPVDGAIFFVAARESNASSLSLGKIDLADGSIKYWDEADTASTRTISVDKIKKRIYVAIYDTEEEDIAITRDVTDHATPEYTICSFDYNLSDKQEVLHKDNIAIKALYAIDNRLLYRADDTIAPLPDTTTISEVIDLSNMKVLFKSEEQFAERGSFTRDKEGVYVLETIGEDEGIYYYDFETREYTPIIKSGFGSVANFQLMYQDEKSR